MRNLDDAALERRLRAVLNEHLGALPLDLTVDALDRRWEAKGIVGRLGRGRGITLLAAAALLVVGGALAAGSGVLRLPFVVPRVAKPSVVAVTTAQPSASPIPVAAPGGVWIPVGSMVTPRGGHDTVRLLDGRVLAVGGSGGESDPATAELYDPATGTWSATGSMLKPRGGFAPVVLLDGKVLVGDVSDGSNGRPDVYGSELYDPATGTWSATGDQIGFGGGSAVVLPDGTVFDKVAVYDPVSGAWTAIAKKNYEDKAGGAPVVLPDGKVLVAGGYGDWDGEEDPSFAFTDSAEVYDPATGSWTEVANMHEPSRADMATPLPDGTALVVGRYGSWEIYDPATGTWTALVKPTESGFPRTVLSDGTVLMIDCTAAALYDPRTASLTAVSRIPRCADTSSLTRLLDGTVLMSGGIDCNSDGVCISSDSAALYVPAGVPLPSLPAFPSAAPPSFPSPTPVPTPFAPTAGPIPPNARSWTVTVENHSSEDAALFVGNLGDDGMSELVGSATPNVVPAGSTVEVTFLFPAIDDGWIYVNPRPGEGGGLVSSDDIGIPGKIVIGLLGGDGAGWVSP